MVPLPNLHRPQLGGYHRETYTPLPTQKHSNLEWFHHEVYITPRSKMVPSQNLYTAVSAKQHDLEYCHREIYVGCGLV